MSRFLISAAALLVSATAALAQADAAAAPPHIAGLVRQLGSRRFREREAATKALDRVGEPALTALRKAAKDHADAEVRRRAGALVERIEYKLTHVWAKRIIESNLSPTEKGRKLRRFIRRGMTSEQVGEILGMWSSAGGTLRWRVESYRRFDLLVEYDTDMRAQRVHLWSQLPTAK